MEYTFWGISIVVRSVLSKAQPPIDFKDEGRTIEERLLQWLKEHVPRDVMPSGMMVF
jgi:hypothetical protein